jgi:stage III sporulation protein SpoIIIAA
MRLIDAQVVIVDTSNEIAGDGSKKHPSVGYSRRMMVPTREKQAQVMIECVQNHRCAAVIRKPS